VLRVLQVLQVLRDLGIFQGLSGIT